MCGVCAYTLSNMTHRPKTTWWIASRDNWNNFQVHKAVALLFLVQRALDLFYPLLQCGLNIKYLFNSSANSGDFRVSLGVIQNVLDLATEPGFIGTSQQTSDLHTRLLSTICAILLAVIFFFILSCDRLVKSNRTALAHGPQKGATVNSLRSMFAAVNYAHACIQMRSNRAKGLM